MNAHMPSKSHHYRVTFIDPGRSPQEFTANGWTTDDDLPGFTVFVDQDHVMVTAVKASDVLSIERKSAEAEQPTTARQIRIHRGSLDGMACQVDFKFADGTEHRYVVTRTLQPDYGSHLPEEIRLADKPVVVAKPA